MTACAQLEAVPFDVVLCRCGRTTWRQVEETALRCLNCDKSIFVRNSVLDYRQCEARDTLAIRQWECHYKRATPTYSVANDWVRIDTWRKHLFDRLPNNPVNPVIVDIGCGTADRIAILLPPKKMKYRYVGVDSSQEALEKASLNIPGSLLIRADVNSLRLRDEVADVVLCLGLLMYFEDPSPVLKKLLGILKPEGLMLLHEAVPSQTLRRFLSRMRSGQGDGFPNACGARMANIAAQLTMHGRIRHRHLAGSPFRRPLCNLLGAEWAKRLHAVVLSADSLWCETAGLLVNAWGAAEFQFVFQKISRSI